MVKFVGLRAKTYTYLTDERCEEKKTKDRKRWVIEKNKSENYKDCLETTQYYNERKYLEKNKI